VKRKIILSLCLLVFCYCYSQTYFLNINLNNGTKKQYPINNIKEINFSGVVTIDDNQKIEKMIQSFKLLDNYPNPFNPSTTIEYEIPKPGFVNISIYDLKGKLIKTLVHKKQEQGNYRIQWDGKNNSGLKVSSGVYIYAIENEKSIISKKMILVK